MEKEKLFIWQEFLGGLHVFVKPDQCVPPYHRADTDEWKRHVVASKVKSIGLDGVKHIIVVILVWELKRGDRKNNEYCYDV